MVDPRSVIPANQQLMIAHADAADQHAAQFAEYEHADQVSMAARMREHEQNAQVAAMGHTTSEILAARQAQVDALAAAGYDPQAAPGSPGHPAVLVDGTDVTHPGPGSRVAVEAAAVRYAQNGTDAQLARVAAEREAWDSEPAIMRMRHWSQTGRRVGSPPPVSQASGDAVPVPRQASMGDLVEITRTTAAPAFGNY